MRDYSAASDIAASVLDERQRSTRRKGQLKNPQSPHSHTPLSMIWADDIELDLDQTYLVAGLLGSTGLTVVYGESGCGKTFWAVDLAGHIACGLPWHGKRVEQGPVIYVAAESPESVKRRLYAWRSRHEVDAMPIAIVQSSINLMDNDAERIVELGREIIDQYGRVALVVIDTLARSMVGNENSGEDMGAYVMACDTIRAGLDTQVMVIHHCGKNDARGARGHSSLKAATDQEIEVVANQDSTHSAKATKVRDDANGENFGFMLDVVELGENAYGEIVTTCVARASENRVQHSGKSKNIKLTDNASLLLECLEEALATFGTAPPPCDQTKGVPSAVRTDQWREIYNRRSAYEDTEKGKNSRYRAFSRGVTKLQGLKRVDGWTDWWWIVRP